MDDDLFPILFFKYGFTNCLVFCNCRKRRMSHPEVSASKIDVNVTSASQTISLLDNSKVIFRNISKIPLKMASDKMTRFLKTSITFLLVSLVYNFHNFSNLEGFKKLESSRSFRHFVQLSKFFPEKQKYIDLFYLYAQFCLVFIILFTSTLVYSTIFTITILLPRL